MNIIYFLTLDPKIEHNNSKNSINAVPSRIEMKQLCSDAGKLIVKKAASELLGAEEERLIFEKQEKGKPYFKNYPYFHFNISHSDNAVAVAISNREVGIDCEKIRKANPKLANRFFTENENAYINQKPTEADARFFEIWTKKEAFLKLSGKGITIPLNSFDVTDSSLSESFYSLHKNDFIISVCTRSPAPDFNFLEIEEEDIPNL